MTQTTKSPLTCYTVATSLSNTGSFNFLLYSCSKTKLIDPNNQITTHVLYTSNEPQQHQTIQLFPKFMLQDLAYDPNNQIATRTLQASNKHIGPFNFLLNSFSKTKLIDSNNQIPTHVPYTSNKSLGNTGPFKGHLATHSWGMIPKNDSSTCCTS